MNITTAGVCANCGWSQFAQVTTVSTRTTGEIEIMLSGKALLDDYKRLLLENRNLKERVAELEAENGRLQESWLWETVCPDGSLRPKVSELLLNLDGWKERSNGWESIVETLNTRIAELEAEQRWIPVSEGTKGLEILEDYLTTDESGEISKMKYCGVLRGVQKWLRSDNAFYHPTHWMPLPQPPEVQA
jgi:hypothetical protein